MATHWTDRRRATALLGRALERAGWRLLGWKPDRSDSMTDYYDPEAWDGVAVLPLGDGRRAVCGVGLTSYDVKRLSGTGPATCAPPTDGPCSACSGTGKALRDAPEMVTRDILTWRPVSVSPAQVAGVTPCEACGATGRRLERRGTVHAEAADWPTFQETPRGASWHVEIDGRIVATGSGVFSALRGEGGSYGSACAARFDAVADRITAAARLPVRPAPAPGAALAADVLGAIDGAPFRVRPSTVRADYCEVVFTSKPAAEIRDALKRAGFRWSGRTACWYGPAARLPATFQAADAAEAV